MRQTISTFPIVEDPVENVAFSLAQFGAHWMSLVMLLIKDHHND